MCGFLYAAQPDWGCAITILPPWGWIVPGLLLAALGFQRERWRRAAGVVAIWLVYGLAFSEEPHVLARSLLPRDQRDGRRWRVVTLNCGADAPVAAMEETIAYQPDIILLQESPPPEKVAAFAQRCFSGAGTAIFGGDVSLVARGEVTAHDAPSSERWWLLRAHVRRSGGDEVEVMCLRLKPHLAGPDMFSVDYWRGHRDVRQQQRGQVATVMKWLNAIPASLPVIVGGDFNAPSGDPIYRPLGPRLRDAFGTAGRGWGDTFANEFPAVRIDQVWVSGQFFICDARVHRTQHSDHRLVVVDLVL